MSALDMFPEVVPTEDPNRRYTTAAFMAWIKAKAGVESSGKVTKWCSDKCRKAHPREAA